MKVSFEGIGESVVTFYNNNATDGVPVKISGNGEVSKCVADENFFGVAVYCENEIAAVQTEGYIQVAYSGVAPSLGFAMLSADGTGKVKSNATNGREFLVVDVNTTDNLVGIVL